jgi:dipeptidyl aminopeptidase/acylaminoacyl peptidase
MRNKRAFLLFVVMIVLAVHGLSADDTKTSGKRILIKESGTLFLTDPDGLNRRKIAEKVSAGAFSPDGNLIAYADAKSVSVFSLLGGQTFTLGHVTEGGVASIAWSPDQKRLAYDVEVRMKSWDLFLASYPPSGDAPRNLGPWYETISFSADGKFIVHPSFGPQGPNLLETVNVESGKRETIYKAATVIWNARYSPDGSSIAFMMTDPEDNESENDSGGAVTDLWILPLDSKKPVRVMVAFSILTGHPMDGSSPLRRARRWATTLPATAPFSSARSMGKSNFNFPKSPLPSARSSHPIQRR